MHLDARGRLLCHGLPPAAELPPPPSFLLGLGGRERERWKWTKARRETDRAHYFFYYFLLFGLTHVCHLKSKPRRIELGVFLSGLKSLGA